MLGGYVPDVYAERTLFLGTLPSRKEVMVVEVETEESQNTRETAEQIMALRAWASLNGALFELWIARE